MLPRAKDLRKLWFEWPESLYGRFNFQRDEHIDALMDCLLDNGLPAVVVLGGEPGIGRGFLCDAAAQRARGQGRKVAVWHLDLDGFEPDIENPLTHYLRHLIDQEERQLAASREKAKGVTKDALDLVGQTSQMAASLLTLGKLDLFGQASQIAASLLSLVWQFEDPLKSFAASLSRPRDGNGTPPRGDPDTLHRFLAELTRDRKLLMHVSDGPQLTSDLRRWLIREAERAPERLLLVLSCPLDQATEKAAPEARSTPERIDVQPLDAAELRDLLDRRFDPNDLPSDLIALLMRRTHGRPAAIANLLADLMEAELLFSEGETWRLPPAGLKNPRLVEAFSRGLFEEVDKRLAILAEEEPALAHVLRDLLFLAALCGRHVPIAALLEHLHLAGTTAEAALDWVDDVLVGELGWLTDLGFHVAGFPGHSVYAFTHPLLPLVVLDQESEGVRELRAEELLRFLEQRIEVTRRGWARCFLAIAEHLGDREREPYEHSLAWWIGMEAADALEAEIRMEIESGKIDPELVWRVADESKTWPPYRRLAVLEAYAQARIEGGEIAMAVLPFDRLADFHLLRAELLIGVGRYTEALADALKALLVLREPMEHARALNLSGLARLQLGDARAAKLDFEAALVLFQENLGEEHPNTLALMNHLSLTLRAIGDFTDARKLQEQVLAIQERLQGLEHLGILTSRNNLAGTLRVLGDLAGARRLQEQNLEILERVLGREHPNTLTAMSNLAETLRSLGDLANARKLQEQTLEIRERVLGREHPDSLMSRNNLALTLRALGDLAGARKLEEQALKFLERELGREHPNTLSAMNSLAETLRALGEFNDARKIQEQTLELRGRVLGLEHPDTLTSRNNLASTLRDLGDLAGARKLYQQSVELLERVLGAEHPDTLASRNNLATTLRDLGDFAGARKLHEQTLGIQERVLGGEHPDTTISTWNLLVTVLDLNDSSAEAQLVDKLRWLVDRDEDSISSVNQRAIRQELLKLLNLS